MKRGGRAEALTDFLSSPANLTGLGLASLALLARLTGIIDAFWLLIVAGSYGLGWQIGRLAVSHDRNRREHREARAGGAARIAVEREDIDESLNRVMRMVTENRGGLFDSALQRAVTELCARIRSLIERMEASAGFISTEDAHGARRIALDYLPGLIESFMAIPREFAAKKALTDGKTARELLHENLAVLQRKAAEMSDDLAAQDARSFLNHARFLQNQFEQSPNLIQASEPKPEDGNAAGNRLQPTSAPSGGTGNGDKVRQEDSRHENR
ncbi:MAG: hypothetical protein P9F19_01180 [Candidatus Contendobacter sp.]|nr:hypothetical protein [Candidatus Contendobacter sp.]MDG4556001.1 hypothetical protein [Candidatus Contendobacter sp.]